MSSLQQLFTSRKPYNAATYVAHAGKIFYDETLGYLRIGDGITPGGHSIGLPPATTSTFGGVKLGPGIRLNADNQIIIDSTGLSFNFGDFQATTPAGGAATLSAINTNQNINIVSSGTATINVIGNFHVHTASSYDPNVPDSDGAIFRVDSNGYVRILAPDAVSTNGAVNIIGSVDGNYQQPINTGVMLHITGIAGSPGVPSRVYNDAQNAFAAFVARRYNGTALSPTAVLADEEIMRISGTAHNGTTIPGTGNQRIVYKALGNQTLTNQGGYMEFWATPQNTTTIALVASVDNINGITSTKFTGPLTGNVTGTATTATYAQSFNTSTLVANAVIAVQAGIVTTAAQPAITSVGTLTNLTIAAGGSITTPTIIFNGGGVRQLGSTATVTLDFRTDSIVTFTQSANATIIINNPTAGRIVKVFMQTGGTAYTLTHGVAATNSTNGAVNFGSGGATGIQNNQTTYLEYTCVGGTTATTYLTATYK